VRISADEARQLALEVLQAAGVPDEAASTQVDLLVEAELRGRASHGLQRLPIVVERIRAGLSDPRSRGVMRWRSEALLDVDGRGGLGPVVALAALDALSERARVTGIAAAVVANTNHLGMLGWYVERIAVRGQIALAMTTSEALVHPWGGVTAEVGSNPIAIGVPASPAPLVLDMATSATSKGLIQHYAEVGRPLPAGWAVDSAGEPTTNASVALDGSISPFGGAKGYGLAIAFEAMVGSLTGTAFGRDVAGTLDASLPVTKGDFFLVLEPGTGHIAADLDNYFDTVRASAPSAAAQPVLIPGEGGRARRERALGEGIDVPELLVRRLQRLCAVDGTPANESQPSAAVRSES
jgi:L-2-hydroxycarboxylate dehydrogenase (NAD+)